MMDNLIKPFSRIQGVFLTCLLLIYCSKVENSINPTVYAVGKTQSNAGSFAAYWQNDATIPLSGLTDDSYANCIYISGEDVYIGGGCLCNNVGTSPIVWKNGSPFLTDNDFGEITSVFVTGNDVYCAGVIASFNGDQPAYWKNGQATLLGSPPTNPNAISSATLVFVSNNDVYVIGKIGNDSTVLWKNESPLQLIYSKTLLAAAALGPDIYFVGQGCSNGCNAAYWKNGMPIFLREGTVATSIFFVGNDVYIGGWNCSASVCSPIFWKNGIQTNKIPNGNYPPNIAVIGSDTYILEAPINGDLFLWKNGSASKLGDNGFVAAAWLKAP
jgi:hypothetical protein